MRETITKARTFDLFVRLFDIVDFVHHKSLELGLKRAIGD